MQVSFGAKVEAGGHGPPEPGGQRGGSERRTRRHGRTFRHPNSTSQTSLSAAYPVRRRGILKSEASVKNQRSVTAL